jgi:hypothetical protein
MSPLNKGYYLKKQLFDLEVKGQGSTKVIMVAGLIAIGFLCVYNYFMLLSTKQNMLTKFPFVFTVFQLYLLCIVIE